MQFWLKHLEMVETLQQFYFALNTINLSFKLSLPSLTSVSIRSCSISQDIQLSQVFVLYHYFLEGIFL